MKTTIYAAVLCLFSATIFTGCKKENSETGTSTYYIKGKKDGIAFSFDANAMAMISDFTSSGAGTQVSFMANAHNAGSMEGVAVSISFSNGVTPAVGTYTEDNPGSDYVAAGVYNPNSMTISWGAGLHSPSAKPLKITILTKTATEMTGTFEGAFYKQDASTGTLYDDFILFTGCEFKLPVK